MIVPNIKFEYAEVLDFLIAEENPNFINHKNIEAVVANLPGWNKLWEMHGTPVLKKVTQLVGRKFLNSELIVNFTLRPDIFAVSPLLIITAHPFIKNPPTDQEHTIFINFVIHELLHRFLDQNFNLLLNPKLGQNSALMTKYIDEDIFVIVHLHLFAIQKEAYLNLDQSNSWKKIEDWISTVPGNSYQRAYQIVKDEGSSSFIKELIDH